jgi:uncharacterized protein (DUF1501 family)
MNSRRQLLHAALAGAAGTTLGPWSSLSLAASAATASPGSNRFVLLILRGGMDGLVAVPALGDPAFAEARGPLAQFGSAPLPLDNTFALHPLLPQLHNLYGSGELAVIHATGLPYRERSHFDAQQLLESGGSKPHELNSGWLGRALAASAGASGSLKGVALETAVPLVLRGPVGVDTWAPSSLPDPAPDLVQRLETMYRSDPALAQALQRAKALRDVPGMGANPQAMGGPQAAGRRAAVTLATKASEFLQRGTQVAVMELGGWDSHINAANPNGALANTLRTLDATLAALKDGLSANGTWGRTVVLVATEFGREVAVNGNGGTDHGTGGAAFVLGGAVRGGRVIADWPGLARKDRFEGRDLRVTTDLRAVVRTVLAEHLRVPRAALDTSVLPGSASLPLLDLLRLGAG